jgi:hypothetical protein
VIFLDGPLAGQRREDVWSYRYTEMYCIGRVRRKLTYKYTGYERLSGVEDDIELHYSLESDEDITAQFWEVMEKFRHDTMRRVLKAIAHECDCDEEDE